MPSVFLVHEIEAMSYFNWHFLTHESIQEVIEKCQKND